MSTSVDDISSGCMAKIVRLPNIKSLEDFLKHFRTKEYLDYFLDYLSEFPEDDISKIKALYLARAGSDTGATTTAGTITITTTNDEDEDGDDDDENSNNKSAPNDDVGSAISKNIKTVSSTTTSVKTTASSSNTSTKTSTGGFSIDMSVDDQRRGDVNTDPVGQLSSPSSSSSASASAWEEEDDDATLILTHPVLCNVEPTPEILAQAKKIAAARGIYPEKTKKKTKSNNNKKKESSTTST